MRTNLRALLHFFGSFIKVIEPRFQRDFISLLPRELALHVLSNLKPFDLMSCAQTCRTWRQLADDNDIWRQKCYEENITGKIFLKNFFLGEQKCLHGLTLFFQTARPQFSKTFVSGKRDKLGKAMNF